MGGASSMCRREPSLWRDQGCICQLTTIKAEVCDLISSTKVRKCEAVIWRNLLWQGGRSTSTNRSSLPLPDALLSEAIGSTPGPLIDTSPPTIMETYKVMNRMKAGKAPGPCGFYWECIQHGGSDALHALHQIIVRVWRVEVAPDEWHLQGIIIPIHKGKGSRSDCCNYRGITLLSVRGEVFVHVIQSFLQE